MRTAPLTPSEVEGRSRVHVGARPSTSLGENGGGAILFLFLALLLCGCPPVKVPLPYALSVSSDAGKVQLLFSGSERKDAERLELAAKEVTPKLARWGALQQPVTVRIVPSRAQLDAESGGAGIAWLKAWARSDSIVLLAPSQWAIFAPAQSELEQLLLHELTHCLTYQLAQTARTGRKLPLWFREGMALVTAGQGYKLASLEDLARHYERGGVDPLTEPELLYRNENQLVYGAAHHAFAFLLRRYGDDSVKQLLALMSGTLSFDDAFEQSLGLSEDAFIRDFRRYVRLRGFRGGRLHRGREFQN